MINKNYILWSLIAIPILSGSFLIARQGLIKISRPLSETQKSVKTLPNPPDIIKAVYLTSSSGGNEKKIDWLIDLAKRSELNSVVIDIKDFSGYVAYDSDVVDAEKYEAERIDIKNVNSLISRLHENNIYVIARITVFQDPVFAKARPDLAVKNKYTGGIWHDNNGLAWINPVASGSWDYFVAIAQDAVSRGFDELNFDYIRFPSDGNMGAIVFPGLPAQADWDDKTPKADIIGQFYKYLRQKLPDTRLSADMFGFVTTHKDDLGIGQVVENAFASFDFVSPMVYPSHYPPTYMGFANPAEHPYEIVNYSMKGGMEKLLAYKQAHPESRAEFRPWLQDFDLGADYTPAMVSAQIKATQDALGDTYNGFMLWNARNVYSESIFGLK